MQTNSIVTLFRFDEAVGEYINIGCFDGWVYRQSRTRTDSNGTYSNDIFDVRIPALIPSGVRPDDLICFEKITHRCAPLENCCRVSAVTHSTAASCPHWHIEAENRYR